jgi:hypothetical protein
MTSLIRCPALDDYRIALLSITPVDFYPVTVDVMVNGLNRHAASNV